MGTVTSALYILFLEAAVLKCCWDCDHLHSLSCFSSQGYLQLALAGSNWRFVIMFWWEMSGYHNIHLSLLDDDNVPSYHWSPQVHPLVDIPADGVWGTVSGVCAVRPSYLGWGRHRTELHNDSYVRCVLRRCTQLPRTQGYHTLLTATTNNKLDHLFGGI